MPTQSACDRAEKVLRSCGQGGYRDCQQGEMPSDTNGISRGISWGISGGAAPASADDASSKSSSPVPCCARFREALFLAHFFWAQNSASLIFWWKEDPFLATCLFSTLIRWRVVMTSCRWIELSLDLISNGMAAVVIRS